MIRDFENKDLETFEPNEFSDISDIPYVFDDEDFWKYTLTDDGRVLAVICFKENMPGDWASFLLISRYFKFKNAPELKAFMLHCIKKLNPRRVWTASRDCSIINRWQKYLGMTKESDTMVNGRKLNIWSFTSGN